MSNDGTWGMAIGLQGCSPVYRHSPAFVSYVHLPLGTASSLLTPNFRDRKWLESSVPMCRPSKKSRKHGRVLVFPVQFKLHEGHNGH